jgi:hypothetical protein
MASAAELAVHGIKLRLDEAWRGSATEQHGAFVTHLGCGLVIHVRGWTRFDPMAELLAQNWSAPPFDVVERTIGERRIVGGTYAEANGRQVREWFVSDGRRAANAGLLFVPPIDLSPFEALVDSIELG